MSEVRSLIERLNPICRRSLEAGAALCVAQTHYNVEIEHVLLKLLDNEGNDLHRILGHYGVEPSTLARQLRETMETFDRGNSRTPSLSPQLLRLLREGWSVSSLRLDGGAVRSGGLLLSLLEDEVLRPAMLESCPILRHISREDLEERLDLILQDSREEGAGPVGGLKADAGKKGAKKKVAKKKWPGEGSEPGDEAPGDTLEPRPGEDEDDELSPTAVAEDSALGRFTIDLTAEAREGNIDPIRGRAREIRQVIDILTRRRQNNPILVGDAGVGKTAIAEGFALKVAGGEVPEALREIAVRILDLGLLQAGASIKGQFEERLKGVISEVKGSDHPVILFIDEAHSLIGAGGSAGQGDAANLLKPALARGELRTIAATTWSEYKKYVEKDPALARRFQLVRVEEPEPAAAIDMLRGLVPNLESHHRVRILDEGVRDAVHLSHRYLPERRLPDKAIAVLDTACARVALAQEGTPAPLEDVARRIRLVKADLAVLEREGGGALGRHRGEAELREELASFEAEHEEFQVRWDRERERVAEIHRLEVELEAAQVGKMASEERAEDLADELAELKEELTRLQGPEPLVPLAVDSRSVAAVISSWTGVPLGRMLSDEVGAVLTLEARLSERLVGQPQALDAIARRIATSRAGLEDPSRPKGVFLLVGPTGVGKTETAIQLAEVLYGGERNLISFNMSEFQESHSVATLKGSPPGYVGFGSGGVLTEAVRRRPYSAVLLDEIEKAHPDVLELFFQVFDKGVLEDGEGVPVDFKNAILLLTSNVGAEAILEASPPRGAHQGGHLGGSGAQADLPTPERLIEAVWPALVARFRPAFLGRVVVVPYLPLGPEEIEAIVRLKLEGIRRRVRETHGAELTYDPDLVGVLARKCAAGTSGARNIDHLLTHTILPELSARILEKMARGESFQKVHISADAMGRFT